MTSFRSVSLTLTLMLCLFSLGCGEEKKPATTTTPSSTTVGGDAKTKTETDQKVVSSNDKSATNDSAKPVALTPTNNSKTDVTPAESAGNDTTPKAAAASGAKQKTEVLPSAPAKSAAEFGEAAYLSDSVVGLVVARPKQFLSTPAGKLLTQLEFEQQPSPINDLLKRTKLKLGDIERATIVFEQSLVDSFARQAGFAVGDQPVEAPQSNPQQLKNVLKQMGLAFHNYHDVFSRFPRADGDGAGQQTGLSWRVHVLPFLDQAPLYNQFHMDEPWDSDHNKTLIAQMPAVFKSPGVAEEDKTSFHVFTGDKTPFTGEQGPRLVNFTDGTSNTILAVLAGPDTAEIWTKPGGLEVDPGDIKKSLGELKEGKFLALIADGSVQTFPADIDDTSLGNLIQPNDGNIVAMPGSQPSPPEFPTPTVIGRLAQPANRSEIANGFLNSATEDTHEGQKFQHNQSMAVWFPNDTTVIIGKIEAVKKMISTKQSGHPGAVAITQQLTLEADYTMVFDLEAQADLIQQIVERGAAFNPMLGMLSNIKSLSGQFSAGAAVGKPLLNAVITTVSPEMASGLSGIAMMGVEQAKATAKQLDQLPAASIGGEEVRETMKQLVMSAKVTTEGDRIQLNVQVPKGFDQLPDRLMPVLQAARSGARQQQRLNGMKMMGLAFHNFHDTFNAFPGASRMTMQKQPGLSWRVFLLPYLDQAPLFNRFNLDEPWDSEHNKALLPLMPEIFKSPGVEDATKTSYHVFTGPKAPFADDQTPGLRQFTDGSSNTILVVLAGPTTADVWTKPGGLDFDPSDPLASIGQVVGDVITALMADGAVRSIDKSIDADNFRRLIQMNDGEPISNQ